MWDDSLHTFKMQALRDASPLPLSAQWDASHPRCEMPATQWCDMPALWDDSPHSWLLPAFLPAKYQPVVSWPPYSGALSPNALSRSCRERQCHGPVGPPLGRRTLSKAGPRLAKTNILVSIQYKKEKKDFNNKYLPKIKSRKKGIWFKVGDKISNPAND